MPPPHGRFHRRLLVESQPLGGILHAATMLLASLLLHLLASTLHLFMLSNLAIDLLEHEHQRVTV